MLLKFSSSFIPLILSAVPHFTASLSCDKDFLITPSQLSSQNGFYFSENLDFETPTETSLILTAGDKKEGYNYFKIAFNENKCFNASAYTHISFTPKSLSANSSFYMVFTEALNEFHLPGISSTYESISNYPYESSKEILIPLSDFSKNLLNEPFNFERVREFVICNFLPIGSVWELENLKFVSCIDHDEQTERGDKELENVEIGDKTPQRQQMVINNNQSWLSVFATCVVLFACYEVVSYIVL